MPVILSSTTDDHFALESPIRSLIVERKVNFCLPALKYLPTHGFGEVDVSF